MKPPIRKHITEGKQALKEIMQEQLAGIAQAMINQIMARAKRLSPSQMLDAIKNVDQPGVNDYKISLKTALSVISSDALEQVRKEIPKAKHVKLSEVERDITLSEFDRLPPGLQKRIQTETQLVIGGQLSDLEKAIYFQFAHSHDSTDSLDTIQTDLEESAQDYIDGPSIDAGAGIATAEMINTTRKIFFQDLEVQQNLDALQFTNGDPVTEICQDLAGTIFAADDPEADRYTPPLHWNCKSYIVPVLKGELGDRDIEKLQPSKSSLEDDIQFKEPRSKTVLLLKELTSHHH